MHKEKYSERQPVLSLFMVTLGITAALSTFALDMYLPAFSDISRSFSVTSSSVQSSLITFFIGLSLGQLIYGPLSDRFGRKIPLYAALALFFIASIACAFSESINSFSIFRIFQALGSSGGLVIALAVIRDCYAQNNAAKALSILMLVLGIAPILAPLLGGYVLVISNWRAIFWILALIGMLCLILTVKLPETLDDQKRLKALKVQSVLYTYFYILEDKKFLRYALAGGWAMAGVSAYIAGSPVVLIDLFGVPKQHYGWIFGINAIGLISLSQVNAYLLKYYSYSKILGFGCLMMSIAGLYLMCVSALSAGLYFYLPGLFVFVSALGVIIPNSSAGALSTQETNIGAASAVLGTMQFIFGAFSSWLVSIQSNASPAAMVIVMFGCALTSVTLYLALSNNGKFKSA